jgi:serine/threonine-protein kinase
MHPRTIDGKYEIVRELSKGGMGAVYEARHLLTRRKVALKLILAESLADKRPLVAQRRFEREARAAGSIESRHVVSVLDTGIDAATSDHYIVMELLSGEDLRQLIHRVGKVPAEIVLAIAWQVCLGLRRAHEQGIVHRDIKSANIFLAHKDDGHVEVKILDFGIAKLRADPLATSDGNDLTRSGSVLGSPLYMSPEQATGSRKLDGRSDIWSLGIVMYEALTGATPHGNQALGAVILSICSVPARPIRERAPEVSEEVAALVHKALALEPSQRFVSAAEMQTEIARLLPHGPAIHESVLGAIPEGRARGITAGSIETLPDPSDGGADSAGSPPAQTTVDAVTYGSGASKKSSSVPRRRTSRLLALVGALVVLAAGIVFFRNGADTSSSDTGSSASPPPAGPPEKTPPSPLPPSPPVGVAAPPLGFQNPATTSVPSAPRPEPRATVRKARAPRPQPGSEPTPAAPVASPTTPPASPAAADEPAIDRRFD